MVRKQSYPAMLWGFVKSLKLAVILIISIIVAVTVDIIILASKWDPSPSSFASRAGEIYSHTWFLVLVFLLLINLTACTINGAVRKIRARHTGIGRWGSTVFHAGLIVILLGTLATGNYRTFATIKLIQGEPKQVPYNALVTKSLTYEPGGTMLRFALQSQQIQLDSSGQVKNIDSWIDLSDGTSGFTGRKLADFEKFFYQGLYLFPNKYGYAVGVKVNGPQGKTVADLTVPMETNEFDDGLKSFSKSNYKIKGLPYDFSFDFYPDIKSHTGGFYGNYSAPLGEPGIYVQAMLNGTAVGRQIIRPGDTMKIQDYSLVFEKVKPWTQLYSVYDPGASIVFWGIIVSLIGLTLFALLSGRKMTADDFK